MSILELSMPDGGPDDEIEILEIHVAVGQAVKAAEVLIEIATDKANFDLEAPADGTIVEIRVEPGDVTTGDAVLVQLEVG